MISKILKNRLLSSLIISFVVFIILTLIFSAGIFSSWDHKLSDSLYTGKTPLDSIVILGIDDKSLQEIGRWPWPREIFVKTLPLLNNSKVVGIDVAFFEKYDKKIDTQLGNEISKLNTVIPIEFSGFENVNGKTIGKEKLIPIPELQNISDVGFINIMTDEDGVTRSAPLIINGEESFALKITQKYLDKNFNPGLENLIINFVGKPKSFKTISFSDVYNNKTDFDFKGKIVLIGATALDLHDDSLTPTSEGIPMPGVEIHANIIQTLLTQSFLNKQSDLGIIITILFMSILTALALYYFRFITATIFSAVIFFVYLFLSLYLFDKGMIVNLVYPFLAVIFTYVAVIIFFYFSEGRERKRVKSLFSKYVSKDIVNIILEKTERDEITLEGEERDVSILFADIRGFTSMSENMKPKEVVAMLNTYLGSMTENIFNNKGTLDKYIGDCSMAIFGAPLEDPDHALNAIKAGIEMRDKILKLQKGNKKKVHVGIGINSGEAVIGNMGSKERVDYTAIGDTVNTASRLCGKAEGGDLIISEATYQRVKDKVKAKYVGEVTVKGKVKPIRIYNVINIF